MSLSIEQKRFILSYKSLELALKEREEDVIEVQLDIAKGKITDRNKLAWAELDVEYSIVDLAEAKESKLYKEVKHKL